MRYEVKPEFICYKESPQRNIDYDKISFKFPKIRLSGIY